MRIAIDASTISTQGGPRTFVLGLLEALHDIEEKNEYVVFYNDACHIGRFPWAKEIVLTGKGPLARLWREHVKLPLACRRENVNVLHCPKSAIPLLSPGCPVVVTLHDLIPIKHPETEKWLAQQYWKLHIPRAAKKSALVMTDSEHAKREIVAEYSVPPEQVKVVLLGYNPKNSLQEATSSDQAVRDRYDIGVGYILYVGTIQPRKNLVTLIEALDVLNKRFKDSPNLVIVGRKGWLYDQLFERIKELGLESRVHFTGFVPDEDLPALYAGAKVFTYISLFEGFGLPPLEAMTHGVPVVVSNTTSIPEVVGDAGISVAPKDIEAVAGALQEILENEELAQELSLKGKARAAEFSWENTAREVMDVYRSVTQNTRTI